MILKVSSLFWQGQPSFLGIPLTWQRPIGVCLYNYDDTLSGSVWTGTSKRTADDLPVHSFRSLIADLGTLTMNKMQLAVGGTTFSLPTQPTPLLGRTPTPGMPARRCRGRR